MPLGFLHSASRRCERRLAWRKQRPIPRDIHARQREARRRQAESLRLFTVVLRGDSHPPLIRLPASESRRDEDHGCAMALYFLIPSKLVLAFASSRRRRTLGEAWRRHAIGSFKLPYALMWSSPALRERSASTVDSGARFLPSSNDITRIRTLRRHCNEGVQADVFTLPMDAVVPRSSPLWICPGS